VALARQDSLVAQVPRDQVVCQGPWDPVVRSEILVRLVLLVPRVRLVRWVRLEAWASLGGQESPDRLEKLEFQAFQEPWETLDSLGLQDSWVPSVRQVQLDLQDFQVLQVQPAVWEDCLPTKELLCRRAIKRSVIRVVLHQCW